MVIEYCMHGLITAEQEARFSATEEKKTPSSLK